MFAPSSWVKRFISFFTGILPDILPYILLDIFQGK